jgi:hypothetical protein
MGPKRGLSSKKKLAHQSGVPIVSRGGPIGGEYWWVWGEGGPGSEFPLCEVNCECNVMGYQIENGGEGGGNGAGRGGGGRGVIVIVQTYNINISPPLSWPS